jgi:succinate dehydrogenase/fumarate reductase cytochrome b subunit
LWVRLHALSGGVALAGYLLLHLLAQAAALGGMQRYERVMSRVDSLPGFALGLVLCVYLPLGVHAALGLRRLLTQQTYFAAGWVGRWGRQLQHASGGLLLCFLLLHVWQFRGRLWSGELGRSDVYPELTGSLSSTALGGLPLVALGYLAGVAVAALHAGQGLYHAARAWGLCTAAAEPRLRRACGAGAALLFALGALIVIDLATGSVVIHFPRH